MATDYLSYFKLNDDPFRLTPDTAYFYNSPAHATALLSIEYCVTQKEGFCVLTGEPGTGKTTILRLFTEKWKDRAEIALIMTPRLSPDEFFRAILDDFKIPLSSSKNDMLKAFRGFLLTHAANNKRVAIIVDEAQELPGATLEELRLLSNLETEKEKLLQIILIGQPELRTKLLSDPLRQLNQRITVRVQLKPLTEAETSDYINTRLIKGGNSSLLFNQKAKDLIFDLSGGIPRTINLLASRGLMSAFLDGSREVFDTHIKKGASDVMEPLALSSIVNAADKGERRSFGTSTVQSVSRFGKSSPALAAGLILTILAGVALYVFTLNSPFTPKPGKPPATPVAAQISSARQKQTGSETPIATTAEIPRTARIAKDISSAEPLTAALKAFNALALAWNLTPAEKRDKAGMTPESSIEQLASRKGLELLQFNCTLDQVLEMDYPAVLMIGTSATGQEIYSTLVKVSGSEYVLSPLAAGINSLTRNELEHIWQGKTLILFKNHYHVPTHITAGTKGKAAGALQKLLKQAGVAVTTTGVFDRKTVEALNSYQEGKGLKVTGQPDPQTLLYLYKESTELYRPKLK